MEHARTTHGEQCVLAQHRLPVDGAVRIIQGWDGPWSHRDQYPRPRNSLLHSVDFAVPYGTVIRAARSGILRLCVTDCYTCIEEPHPSLDAVTRCGVNFMAIECQDGTHDCYLHLAPYSVRIREGERAVLGQELAMTGRSGWVGVVPHLHFHVQETLRRLVTRPFAFRDYPRSLWHRDIGSQA